ncbi:sugar phosphate isomerase/epimerase family protein [Nocardioides sp. GY 10127]|uniref:sugar phosphate isomerase/epimerase family protein n=1 Tax=Nocardioides sp. GY 10127 TaxID=2569762 RepID=UPI0014587157|nr:sugar phosphate isomerase/epimerase family protein [Nocardioides sp. GY 10127]
MNNEMAENAAEKSGLRLSCADYSFRPLQPWESAMQAIAGLGLDGVDLCLIGGSSHLNVEDLMADPDAMVRRINDTVAATGVAIADIALLADPDLQTLSNFGYMAANNPDPELREAADAMFEAVLDVAARVGARSLTVLPGVLWPHETKEESFQRTVTVLTEMALKAQARGVKLCVEPHVGSVIQDPEDALRLCQEAAPCGLTLDYSHFISRGVEQDALDELTKHAVYVHARAATTGRLQVPLERSEIDFPRWMDVLTGNGYEGYVGFEYVNIEGDFQLDDIDTLTETAKMRDLLRGHWATVDAG